MPSWRSEVCGLQLPAWEPEVGGQLGTAAMAAAPSLTHSSLFRGAAKSGCKEQRDGTSCLKIATFWGPSRAGML